MRPVVHKETMTGWGVLGGTLLVCLLGLWLLSDGGELAGQVAAAQAGLPAGGKEELRARVASQDEANRKLHETIEVLKKSASFSIEPRFQIPKDDKQPGYLFKRTFVEVRQGLRQKAEARKIVYDENIGFGADPEVPKDELAPYLMTMLQLTEKVVGIALDTPSPLESLTISHGREIETGPESRPALLREFPLKLSVRGSLKDILWILHRLSQVEPGGRDYPVILRGMLIESENAKPRDDVQQLTAEFELAGMRFLSEEERARDPLAKAPGALPATGSHPVPPAAMARP
jgi:hypothetical protein